MGIYYFAVDDEEELQMWAPEEYADKSPGVFYPGNPLPCMLFMKNIQGYNFKIMNDACEGAWCAYKDVTEEVFQELKDRFPDYKWKVE